MPVAVASYRTRFRLAVTGTTIAWTLATLFLVLGWKHREQPASVATPPSVVLTR